MNVNAQLIAENVFANATNLLFWLIEIALICRTLYRMFENGQSGPIRTNKNFEIIWFDDIYRT